MRDEGERICRAARIHPPTRPPTRPPTCSPTHSHTPVPPPSDLLVYELSSTLRPWATRARTIATMVVVLPGAGGVSGGAGVVSVWRGACRCCECVRVCGECRGCECVWGRDKPTHLTRPRRAQHQRVILRAQHPPHRLSLLRVHAAWGGVGAARVLGGCGGGRSVGVGGELGGGGASRGRPPPEGGGVGQVTQGDARGGRQECAGLGGRPGEGRGCAPAARGGGAAAARPAGAACRRGRWPPFRRRTPTAGSEGRAPPPTRACKGGGEGGEGGGWCEGQGGGGGRGTPAVPPPPSMRARTHARTHTSHTHACVHAITSSACGG